jgi:hypothetical protein
MKNALLLVAGMVIVSGDLFAPDMPAVGRSDSDSGIHSSQVPEKQESRLRDRLEKLEVLVKALTHENDLLKKRLSECSGN